MNFSFYILLEVKLKLFSLLKFLKIYLNQITWEINYM